MSNVKVTPEKKSAFLHALSETGNISRACLAIGIARKTAYEWRDEDKTFEANWQTALRIGAEALEDEAKRRAFIGVQEPVYYKGEEVDTITKYSDTLAIFLLKGAMPEKYAERNKTELTGANGGPIDFSNAQLAQALHALNNNLPLPDFSNVIDHVPTPESEVDDGTDLI